MADARGGDAHQHLASLRRRHIYLDNLQGLVGSKGYGARDLIIIVIPERNEDGGRC